MIFSHYQFLAQPQFALLWSYQLSQSASTKLTNGSAAFFLSSRLVLLSLVCLCLISSQLFAHGVAEEDARYLERITGLQFVPYLYLGAKHMVTGYDHLLFLAGVIFFLFRLRDVALYVSLFAIGHSTTLLLGVLGGIRVDPFLVDAVIGLSVVYKALAASRSWASASIRGLQYSCSDLCMALACRLSSRI